MGGWFGTVRTMRRSFMSSVRLLVVAAWLAGCGSAATRTRPPASARAPLDDGVYAVEDASWIDDRDAPPGASESVLRYDPKRADASSREPERMVKLRTDRFVPLVIRGEPELGKTSDGKQLVDIALDAKYVGDLEAFTRAAVGARVAIVLDGQIVSVHKVREPIADGRVQISRCTDRLRAHKNEAHRAPERQLE